MSENLSNGFADIMERERRYKRRLVTDPAEENLRLRDVQIQLDRIERKLDKVLDALNPHTPPERQGD